MMTLIKIARFGVLLLLVWDGITAAIITLSTGESVVLSLPIPDAEISLTVGGVTGEANFGWPLLFVTFASRVIYLYGFYRLWLMFGLFEQKRYFSRDAIQHLKVFTGLFIVFNLMRLAVEVAGSMLSYGDGSFAFDASYLNDLMFPILFYIVAHVLNEARKHEEEVENYF